jgi:hypothetical protein
VADLRQPSQTDLAVSLETLTGWQKVSVKSGFFSGLAGVTTGESVPFLHWHPLLQVVASSDPRHL